MATLYVTAPETATDRIEALHPYEVPCIERFDEAALDAFADWRANAVE
nr:hypothetical protein [Halapricum sp. CBA1109]